MRYMTSGSVSVDTLGSTRTRAIMFIMRRTEAVVPVRLAHPKRTAIIMTIPMAKAKLNGV
ncbi:MAG: hypothetical protein HN809_11460 [Rhodospirillaceae bacterium]|nr:hypothetical protein [Rhodospirillaceae bacterium]